MRYEGDYSKEQLSLIRKGLEMKVWKVEVEHGEFESIQFVNTDRQFLKEFKRKILSGEPQYGEFDNNKVEIIEGSKKSDFPKFWGASGTLVFSERAKNCLEKYLGNNVEYIPVKLEADTYYVVNILCILDIIDYKTAIFRKLETGLVVGIEKYSFIEEQIKGHNIFKVLLNNRIFSTEIYVTSEIKSKIEEFGLEGLKFIEIWKSN